MSNISFNGVVMSNNARTVIYTGSDTLRNGMLLCYDSGSATAANRTKYVVKPSIANKDDFAGVVRNVPAAGIVGNGVGVEVSVCDPREMILNGATVLTDESVVNGDFLGVKPGSYYFGKAVVGRPLFKVTASADGSSTPTLATGFYGLFSEFDLRASGSYSDYFDHFTQRPNVGTSADTGAWLQTLTGSGTSTIADGGSLSAWAMVTGATDANLNSYQLNGETFKLTTGVAAYYEVKLKISTVATTDFFIGLAATDTSILASAPTDYLGFRLIGASSTSPLYVARKASGTEVATTTGVALTDDTFATFGIYAASRTGSVNSVSYFINGNLITTLSSNAQFPNTVALTPSHEVRTSGGSAAKTMSFDYLRYAIHR